MRSDASGGAVQSDRPVRCSSVDLHTRRQCEPRPCHDVGRPALEQAEHVEPQMTGTGKPVAVLGAVRALCPECAHVDVGALARPCKMNRVLAPDPVRRTSDARGTSRGRRYFDTPAERTKVDRRAGSDLLLPAKGIRDVMRAT